MAKNRYFLPTNTENLKMIIAQGLISSPKGFQKYYKDLLEILPGYILIFKNKIPPEMLNYVIIEDNTLTQCILEIDIKNIVAGTLFALSDGKWVEVSIADIDNSSSDIFLIPAPMPLSTISKVIFKEVKDKNSFEDYPKLYNNVCISEIKLHYTKTDKKLFKPNVDTTNGLLSKENSTNTTINLLKSLELNILEPSDYIKTYAIGGLLTNLFYFTKNGQLSQKIFDAWISGEKPNNIEDYGLFEYLHNNKDLPEDDLELKIYAKMLEYLVFSKDFKEEIINYLQVDSKMEKIAKKLINFDNISEKPFSQEYAEAKTDYGKRLLMLFHRDDTESFIELQQDALREEDYVIYGMLFGIRDKFTKIPKFIREYDGLQNYISTYMSNYYHKNNNTGIEFETPNKPLTLIEMLKNNRFKEYFAKEMKTEDSFETLMAKTDYTVIKGKPVFRGIVMPKFEMLDEPYFQAIKFKKLTEYNNFIQKYQKIK